MNKLLINALAAAALFASIPAQSHDYGANSIKIDHPWSREAPPNAKVIAGFFQLKNKGTEDDFLISASSPVADRVELHTHVMEDDMMKMRQVDSVRIGAMKTVMFKPGGFHLMIFDPKQSFKKGERFPMTLTFKNAGTIEIEVAIEENAHKHEH
ncbi:copper chaperone PCu(A)C [Motilimonas cestriensis]|uniref:Copper chaperone PCu(A)C n=1 Tax=Motilimonas cestriensis TaxID=2742685 RepID=A0ABS8W771_9GAMM|nr:copper chaperone PCu(A)C [Motilimonas cestriensis]MCE2594834.1 copper chaperone PCu(A)C [Motilimonas cestriensis]